MEFRKSPTEKEVEKWLQEGRITLPPLRFRLRKVQPQYGGSSSWDFEVEALWGDQSAAFAVEHKSLSTPKVFEEALRQCRFAKLPRGLRPMLLVPYLRPSQLEALEQAEISGVDCCGNGVVIRSGRLRVFRTGNPNQFTTSATIKNIYRRNTSMVARLLLAVPRFISVKEVLAEVNRRNVFGQITGATRMSMGTVSKALRQLQDELIVERETEIRLLQGDKLLDQLHQNYEPPRIRSVRLKVDCEFDQLPKFVSQRIGRNDGPLMATGLSSVSRYATMQRDEILALCCPDVKRVQAAIGGRETDRFPNVELIENVDQPHYFDARDEAGFYLASPVQSYLELMRGDKRDRDTAGQVKEYILRAVREDAVLPHQHDGHAGEARLKGSNRQCRLEVALVDVVIDDHEGKCDALAFPNST